MRSHKSQKPTPQKSKSLHKSLRNSSSKPKSKPKFSPVKPSKSQKPRQTPQAEAVPSASTSAPAPVSASVLKAQTPDTPHTTATLRSDLLPVRRVLFPRGKGKGNGNGDAKEKETKKGIDNETFASPHAKKEKKDLGIAKKRALPSSEECDSRPAKKQRSSAPIPSITLSQNDDSKAMGEVRTSKTAKNAAESDDDDDNDDGDTSESKDGEEEEDTTPRPENRKRKSNPSSQVPISLSSPQHKPPTIAQINLPAVRLEQRRLLDRINNILKEKNAQLEEEVEKLQEERNTERDERKSAERIVEQYHKKIQELEKQITCTQENSNADTPSKISLLQPQTTQSSRGKKQKQTDEEFTNLHLQLQNQEQKNQSLTNQITTLESQLQEKTQTMQQDLEFKDELLSQAHRTNAHEKSHLKQRIQHLESQLQIQVQAQVQARLDAQLQAQSQADGTITAMEELRKQVMDRGDENEALRRRNSELQNSIHHVTTMTHQKDEALKKLGFLVAGWALKWRGTEAGSIPGVDGLYVNVNVDESNHGTNGTSLGGTATEKLDG